MPATTLSLKVSEEFAARYRAFCEEHCLLIGKFTEQVLVSVMEDFYFGSKAQAVLAVTAGAPISHAKAFPTLEQS